LFSASGSIDDISNTVEDCWGSTNSSTDEVTPSHVLLSVLVGHEVDKFTTKHIFLSSSGGSNDTTNTVEDSWESTESGRKESTELFLLFFGHETTDESGEHSRGKTEELILLGSGKFRFSCGLDDTTNTVEDSWESTESGTEETTELLILFSSSRGINDTTNTVEDSWESTESGTKESAELFILFSSPLLKSPVGSSTSETRSNTTSNGGTNLLILFSSGSSSSDSTNDSRKGSREETEELILLGSGKFRFS